jgi:hypothetical protein
MALKTIDVLVGHEDIKHGTPMTGTGCPVGLAVNRRVRPGRHVRIGAYAVHHSCGDPVPLPAEVTDWVQSFDEGRTCQPISFRLQLPEEVVL